MRALRGWGSFGDAGRSFGKLRMTVLVGCFAAIDEWGCVCELAGTKKPGRIEFDTPRTGY